MKSLKAIMLRLAALIKKEFLVMVSDPGTRKILVLPLIVQSLLFGYGATFNLENVPYVVFNGSSSKDAAEILRRIDAAPVFRLQRSCADPVCFNESIDKGEALIGLMISSDFERTREIFAVTDARNTASANTALSYVQTAVTDHNAQRLAQQRRVMPYTIEYRYRYNEQNVTRYTLMTGMILSLSMIQVMMLASFSVSREREDGTFDMMLMTPLSPFEILLGKAAVPAAVASLQAVLLLLICLFWFEIPLRGNPASLLLIIALFSLCNVGIGLAISALSSTSQQSVVISFSLVLPCILLSGMITPFSAMPAGARALALADPLYYGMAALQRVYLEGQGLKDVAHLLLPLVAIGALTLGTALKLFRGRIG